MRQRRNSGDKFVDERRARLREPSLSAHQREPSGVVRLRARGRSHHRVDDTAANANSHRDSGHRGIRGGDQLARYTLDAISLEVEEALVASVTRGGLARDTRVSRVEAEYADDGDTPVGVIRIEAEIDYVVVENDLESAA